MVTTTTVYGFQKPAVAGDEDAWGGYLNNNIDKYESILTGNTTITNLVITTASVTGDFTVDTNTLHVDATNNRVGIGTTTVDTKLHLEESDTTSVFLKTQNSAGALLVGNNSAGNSFISSQTSGKPLLFETANTERMRIDDSSGSLLVGRTTTSDTNVGGMIRPDGFIQSTRDGNIAADFNRNTSDGEVVRFSKGSSPKGAIGVSSDGPAFGTTTQQVAFHADKLFPCQSYGSALDATIDLGYSGSRFKDIWLSSAVKSSGDLAVDVGGAITLDADGGYIDFADGGTTIGRIENSSSDFKFEARVQDKDILFVGNDGGSGITALQLDMSDAGTATFNHDIKLGPSGGDIFIYYNNAKWLSTPSNAKYLSIGDSGSNAWDGNTGVKLMFGSSDTNAINGYYIGTNLENYGGNYNKLDIDYATGIRIKADKQYGGTRFYDSSNDALLFSVGTGNTDVAVTNNLSVGGDITMAYRLYHEGDTDTYVQFDNNVIYLIAGGSSSFIAASSYSSTYVPMYNYAAYFEEAASLSGTAPTINAANSGNFYLTMTGNTTFTFTNTSSNWAVGFTLYLTGNGGTVAWDGGGTTVRWAGGTAPDAPANGETDVYVFHTRDGSTWYGALAIDAAS